jgi:multiple sugar transport system substrate-binding protein
MIPYGVFYPISKNTVVWEEMAYQVLNDVWSGARPTADVCREIAQRMNVMLAAE